MKDEKEIKKEQNEMSRAELIIHELNCGGFAECELDEIQAALNKAIREKEGR